MQVDEKKNPDCGHGTQGKRAKISQQNVQRVQIATSKLPFEAQPREESLIVTFTENLGALMFMEQSQQ